MQPVAFERGKYVVFLVQVSKSDIKYLARGILYKCSLLEGKTISKVWENYPNFHLAHPILVRPMELQRRHIKVLQAKISDSKALKI
jgi:hypothetical protein